MESNGQTDGAIALPPTLMHSVIRPRLRHPLGSLLSVDQYLLWSVCISDMCSNAKQGPCVITASPLSRPAEIRRLPKQKVTRHCPSSDEHEDGWVRLARYDFLSVFRSHLTRRLHGLWVIECISRCRPKEISDTSGPRWLHLTGKVWLPISVLLWTRSEWNRCRVISR